ncbi:hypothetical protein ANOBCDAF_00421 [Pleomorphomonas sp. T1.2MG-36]|uniref:hypothetical protein n=1 Tax=Pleomorphomonas sp. T1.2MG-36 TaxID=3041167 RepID=UPI002477880B|nr:hypothetical protein [Pleomorphomonas sp. T1.2MG-36]CAI9400129.1 hypothetical protein ANOBCDAF_00421 [Pleomorphomonas sp. T1.2MG-36]
MKSVACGLLACSICPLIKTVAEAAAAIAVQMRAEGATDAEIIDAVEVAGLTICGHCPDDDDIEAEIVGDLVTVNLAPRGPVPAFYAH